MKLGITKERYNDLTEINNLLNLHENNCDVRTADFKSRITNITRPYIVDKFVPLHFELRANYEVCAIGRIQDIIQYFKLNIAKEIPNGYELGIQKEEGEEIKRNPKSYKYFANICNYDRNFTDRLKSDLNLNKDEVLYFYRTEIYLLNEEQTVELLKKKQNYINFNKFAIHTIRRQRKLHKIFNIPYKLNINVTLIEDSPKYKNETSLSFKIEDDNSISLTGTREHVSNFIEPNSINITLSIQKDNTINETEASLSSESKWNFKGLLSNTFKTTRPIVSFSQ